MSRCTTTTNYCSSRGEISAASTSSLSIVPDCRVVYGTWSTRLPQSVRALFDRPSPEHCLHRDRDRPLPRNKKSPGTFFPSGRLTRWRRVKPRSVPLGQSKLRRLAVSRHCRRRSKWSIRCHLITVYAYNLVLNYSSCQMMRPID